MNKPLILMATSMLASLTLLHVPSGAQEEDPRLTSYREYLAQRSGVQDLPGQYTNILVPNDRLFERPNPVLHQDSSSGGTTSSTVQTGVEGIAPLQTFSISNDIFNRNVLGDSIGEGRYRKPNAYEAEHALQADEADFAFTAREADFATNAAVAVRVEEKAPYGQAWDFGLTQVNEGSRTYTQHYARPQHADSVLINANCITAGEKGDLSRVIISFDAVFTQSVSLCEAGRTSGRSEYNRGYNSVNLDVPQGVTSLRVTQYVDKGNNGGTAITDGFVQWFGPHSLASNAPAPTSGTDIVTTPPPPAPTPAPAPAPAPTTGGSADCPGTGPTACEAFPDGSETDSGETDNCLVHGTGYCAPPDEPTEIMDDTTVDPPVTTPRPPENREYDCAPPGNARRYCDLYIDGILVYEAPDGPSRRGPNDTFGRR